MKPFSHVIVVGAGTMGAGIAQLTAMAGMQTTLVDQSATALDSAKDRIKKNLELGVIKEKIDAETRDRTISHLGIRQELSILDEGDLLIEAVPENLALKQTIFRAADRAMPAHAILATNTSSLSITDIASVTQRAQSVVGLHFFNPPHIMKLLEIVRGKKTGEDTIFRTQALGELIGKTSIVVNDSPGFATSRLGICLGLEAMRMLQDQVANVEAIDTAMTLGYGHPMGPLKLTDLVGLDVRLAISRHLHKKLGSDAFRPPRVLEQLVNSGYLGQKSGAGFYHWEEGRCLAPRSFEDFDL